MKRPMLDWYGLPTTPNIGEVWWAVEHKGHPAFYLRALMPGDFAPATHKANLPALRHVIDLNGVRAVQVACGTCGKVPKAQDLEPIERQTGSTGFLDPYRSGAVAWPVATDPDSCWLCSHPKVPATEPHPEITGAHLCPQCAAFFKSVLVQAATQLAVEVAAEDPVPVAENATLLENLKSFFGGA